MNKVFFVFGYVSSSWDEWGSTTGFTMKGIVEIKGNNHALILDLVKKKLIAALKKKQLQKELAYGGSGDLGGGSHTFYGNFFTENKNKEFLVKELNHLFQNRLGELFILPKG